MNLEELLKIKKNMEDFRGQFGGFENNHQKIISDWLTDDVEVSHLCRKAAGFGNNLAKEAKRLYLVIPHKTPCGIEVSASAVHSHLKKLRSAQNNGKQRRKRKAGSYTTRT